ncbi:hypothetical protein ACF058_02085 [Streptomyces sp. NPDC015501]|uniref:hypothetical protein n=1 Tax=unclassified Streptomyces TaxID=2593676 RepID=UPI00126E9997|nr:hypothetical protein A3L22_02060 [Streptomyces griseus subsp. griseus]
MAGAFGEGDAKAVHREAAQAEPVDEPSISGTPRSASRTPTALEGGGGDAVAGGAAAGHRGAQALAAGA